jgi:hypothetical protein
MAKVSYNSLKDLPYIIVEDVLNFVTSEPATPTAGQIYYSTTAGTSSVTATVVSANTYLEWMGASWNEKAVRDGATVYAKDEDKRYDYNGTLLSEATASSLRGEPVANNAALTALVAKDYEQRKVVSDGKEYVFTLGAVLGTLPDDGATGYWKEVVPTSEAVKKSITQTAHGFTEIGTPVYITSAGLYVKADNDTDITSDAIGLVEAIANVNSFTLTQSGYISGITPAVISSGVPTVGSAGFVDSVAGKITTTAPTLSTQFRKPVIIFDSATSGWVIDRTGTSAGTAAVATNIPNSPSSTLAPVAIADKPTGGNIGTAATTVDVNSAFVVTQTTASQTLTLPAPTVTTGSRLVTVKSSASSTTSFTMYSISIEAGKSESFNWDGAAWSRLGVEPATQVLTYGRVNAAANLASKSYVSTGVGSTVDFTATVSSSGVTFSGTNGIIPSVTGRYRAAYYLNAGSDETANNGTVVVVQGGVSLGSVYINQHNSAGSVNQTSGFIDVNVVAGTPVFLHYQPDATEAVVFDKGTYFDLSQLPTAVAPIVDTVAEYGSLNLLSNVGISGGNISAATGVTVLTFTLPSAGVWDVTSMVKAQIPSGANSNAVSGIFDSLGNLVEGSDAIIGMTTTDGVQHTGTANVIIPIPAAATYTIKAWNTFGFGGSINDTPNGATGVRWVKIAGQLPSTGSTVDKVYARQTTTQGAPTVGTIINLEQVVSGNIPFSSNTVTLEAGKTYLLEGSGAIMAGGSSTYGTRFYNVTTGQFIGDSSFAFSPNNANTPTLVARTAIAEITPTVTTQVQLRVDFLSGSGGIIGGSNLINAGVGAGSSFDPNGASWVRVTQIGSTSNVNTLPANDQSSAGYFDIGNMRIQWGNFVQGSGSQTVTLPVAFANSNYTLTGNDNSSVTTNAVRGTSFDNKTTTTFSTITNNYNGVSVSQATGNTIHYIAIGQKP